MDNNNFQLEPFDPGSIAKGIAERFRQRRIEQNLTQVSLAKKAGISLGSLKRFENSHEISLKHLLMIALVIDLADDFNVLFSKTSYSGIEDVVNESKNVTRKRASRNV